MGYRNRFDFSGANQKSGEDAEKMFEDLAFAKNLTVERATHKQQLSHIDFIVTDKKKNTYLFDVKARKKSSRSDGEFDDELIWIELKNVGGNVGWLYGSADYIAFERLLDFVLVPRAPLATLVERLMTSNVVTKSSDALYNQYTRKDRKDLLTQVKMADILEHTKTHIWTK